ncbi:helix-turn-helix domain-containing protein [Paenibacillus dauci]|uniref:helix-turn-helix domain-containing protein n=1 Tax=Paenibacillus dauci TaxID=1567106 RepID=UPI00069794ED|nr:helix-turn-helix transcriptional regulator [Paenibacillus dauci]
MNYRETIQHHIQQFLADRQINLGELSTATGINRGSLSAAINGNPPKMLSVPMLDAITHYMELPEGHYYPLYIEESFQEGGHWRRIKMLLIRCAEIGRLEDIRLILEHAADDLKQIPLIFETAEELYQNEQKEAAALLYGYVVESERSNQSERLAISYYRLFQMHSSNPRKNVEAAMQFIPHRHKLPDHILLDGLILLCHFFGAREDMDSFIKYVDELFEMVHRIAANKSWQQESFVTNRHFVYYYGQAYLLKSHYYEYQTMYDEFRTYTHGYADLSWFGRLSEAGEREVEQFKFIAKANSLSVEIRLGNQSVIPEYVELLQNNEDEILDGLITLIISANTHEYHIDEYLREFDEYLEPAADYLFQVGTYKEEFKVLRYYTLNREYAHYCFRKKEYNKGLDCLMQCFQSAVHLDNKDGIQESMKLLEQYRSEALGK